MTEHDPFLRELQHRADRAHQSADRADDAPPDLWQRVRSQVRTTEEESPAMSTITMPASPETSPQLPASERSGGFGHYANLAVTIAIVIAVAVAGWFATMQLNRPGDDSNQFALAPGTPEVASAICDVEPMTVDEAMVILLNPYQAMEVDEGYAKHAETLVWLKDQSGQTGQPPLEMLLTDGPNGEIEQDELDKALTLGDTYLECVQHGTRAQVFRLLDPVGVHEYLRGMLPLFTSEEEARGIIEEELSKSGNTVWTQDFMLEYLEGKSIRMNRNPERLYIDSSHAVDSFLLDAIVISPIVIYDANGEVVFETEFGGFPVTNNGYATDYARNVSIAKSPFNGEWYVFNIYSP